MGTLYIVPTPVGNMEDITARALRILGEADLILAEDTRTTGVLLSHFGIKNHMLSHHKFNEHRAVDSVVQRLRSGQTIAQVSDAGTPGISDPGFLLAREAANDGHEVICLPGPTAFVPALVCSGLPCDRFVFEGFLPQKKGRQTRLRELAAEERTVVVYESPRRVVRLLEQMAEAMGEERRVCLCREISKVHEEAVRGTVAEALEHFRREEPRGEFVVVIEGAKAQQACRPSAAEGEEEEAKAPRKSKYRLKKGIDENDD